MNAIKRLAAVCLLVCACSAWANAAPLGTSFSYQGKLVRSGSPANGSHDFSIRLMDAAVGGAQVGVTINVSGVSVVNGVFTTALDFGAGAFDGNARWLEISVKGAADPSFTLLSPRQPLTASPQALWAPSSGGGGLTLPFAGGANSPGADAFLVQNTASSGAFSALHGRTASASGGAIGVLGEAVATSGGTVGLYGDAIASPNGTGAVGKGGVTGGYFESFSNGAANATGVYGVSRSSNSGVGVAGLYNGTSNVGYGVKGTATASAFGTGVAGDGGLFGGSFSSFNSLPNQPGAGVYGAGTGSNADGVLGESTGPGKAGVSGGSSNANGYGGYFSNSAGGVALFANGIASVRTLRIIAGADLAERFESDEHAEPGTVMALDLDSPGHLVVCRESYSHGVAGVVSGARQLSAGVTLGDHADDANTLPIALSGRVWVKCDATRAPIHAGDFLTSAMRAGYAMAATDAARAQGAILGKAMSSLDSGTGFVLVLVTLQ